MEEGKMAEKIISQQQTKRYIFITEIGSYNAHTMEKRQLSLEFLI